MRRAWMLVMVVTFAACGVPLEAEPELLAISIDNPPQIVEPTPEDLESVTLYLVRDDTVVPVTRDLSSPADVEMILESLLDGTTNPESRAGLRTSIAPSTRLLGVEVVGNSVIVDLGREFTAVGGEQEILAVAQIVLTATGVDGLESVSFEIESVPTAVPVADGALADVAVTAHEYADLLAAAP